VQVAPIHANEVDRAIDRATGRMAKRSPEKLLEFRRRELARRHFEIGVLDLAQARDVARDAHIVRRVGEHHVRLVGPQHLGIALIAQCVAAMQAMTVQNPKVAHLGHGWGGGIDRG
jgi:hypothetical protein